MMPEEERPDGDTSETIPWDFDNDTYSESEVADLLDDDEEEDE
jgi:hypothetical protein